MIWKRRFLNGNLFLNRKKKYCAFISLTKRKFKYIQCIWLSVLIKTKWSSVLNLSQYLELANTIKLFWFKHCHCSLMNMSNFLERKNHSTQQREKRCLYFCIAHLLRFMYYLWSFCFRRFIYLFLVRNAYKKNSILTLIEAFFCNCIDACYCSFIVYSVKKYFFSLKVYAWNKCGSVKKYNKAIYKNYICQNELMYSFKN